MELAYQVNHNDISKKLVEFVIRLLKKKGGGKYRIEDAVVLFSTIVAERCIEAAGDYSINDDHYSMGKILFSQNINKLLYGNSITEKIIELPLESVFGQIWGLLKNSTYQIDDFPSIKQFVENFNQRMRKGENLGKFPWSVPTENIPSVSPLKVGYESREMVDEILKQVDNKSDKLKIFIYALCDFLIMAKNIINHKIVLLLTLETMNGMSKTFPLTDKSLQNWKRKEAKRYAEKSQIDQSLKQYDLAVKKLNIAIRLNPERSNYFYFLRHQQFLGLGDFEKSLNDIKLAILAPEGNRYYRYLARVYEKLGQIDNAILALEQGCEKLPFHTKIEAYLDLAKLYERIGRLDKASENITIATRLNPRRIDTYHRRSRVYIKMGLFEQALKDCNFCINKEPTEWTHYELRSEVYKAIGDTQSAEEDYKRSMALNPNLNRDWDEINRIIQETLRSTSNYPGEIGFLISEINKFPDSENTVADSGDLFRDYLSKKYPKLSSGSIYRLVDRFCFLNR